MRHRLVALASVGAVLFLSGCGGEETTAPATKGANVDNGKKLFVAKCGQCHAMADAGTQSQVGPDLDNAFGYAREQGFAESTIYDVTLQQMKIPVPPMPEFDEGRQKLSEDQLVDIAAYVATVAGKEPAGQPQETTPAGGTPAAKGEALFTSLGCQGCHSLDGSKSTGPTLEGIAKKRPEAYIVESIVDPDAEITRGYQAGVMSAAVPPGSVSREQARLLVAFLKKEG